MIRVQLDEAIGSRQCLGGVGVLVVGVSRFELRLLGVAAVRILGLELFVVLDGLFVGAVRQRGLGLRVQLLCIPVGGLVDLVEEAGATGEQPEGDNR